MEYVYILFTVVLTTFGQIVIKWQMSQVGELPPALVDKLLVLLKMLVNPWIVSGFLAAFLAALFWMAAIVKLDLSHAYPFVGSTFVLIFFAGVVFFNEPFSAQKLIGVILIVSGVVVGSQG